MQERIESLLQSGDISIEIGQPIRYDEVRELFKRVGWKEESEWTDEEIEKAFNKADFLVTARNKEGKLVSFVRGRDDGPYVFLLNWVTDPDLQNRGVGSHVFKTLMDEINKKKPKTTKVGFAKPDMLRFYKKFGFDVIPHALTISNNPRF